MHQDLAQLLEYIFFFANFFLKVTELGQESYLISLQVTNSYRIFKYSQKFINLISYFYTIVFVI